MSDNVSDNTKYYCQVKKGYITDPDSGEMFEANIVIKVIQQSADAAVPAGFRSCKPTTKVGDVYSN